MTNEKREFLLNKIKAERNFETEMLKYKTHNFFLATD